MKVTLIKKTKELNSKDYEFFKKFIRFLQENIPLSGELNICFQDNRTGKMTTGSNEIEKRTIKILVMNRLNRDILRTLAHEWIHEYQMTKYKKMPSELDLEDEANALSGRLIKQFEKQYPSEEGFMYE